MGTVIIAAISILLVFESLKLIVRIIFAIENMKDNPYKQPDILIPTTSWNRLLRQLNWFFVYSKFLATCQIQIWKIRVQRAYLYLRNRKANNGKEILQIINRVEVPFKDSAQNLILDRKLHHLNGKKVTTTSFNKNALNQFLLFLCSSENQIKLKRKTEQHF